MNLGKNLEHLHPFEGHMIEHLGLMTYIYIYIYI